MSQVLKLLTLDGTILAAIDWLDRTGPLPRELVLRRIAELSEPAAQRARYRAVYVPSAPTSGGTYRRDDDKAMPAPRHDDFQHDLDRARRYQRWLDAEGCGPAGAHAQGGAQDRPAAGAWGPAGGVQGEVAGGC